MNSARWAKRRKSSASRNHQPGGTAMPRRIDEGRTSRRTGDDSRLVKDRAAAGGGFNQATIVAGSGGMPGVAGRTVVAPSDRRGKKRNVGRNTPRPRWEAFLPSELLVRSLGRNYFYPTGRGSSSWWNSFFVIPKLANTSRDHFSATSSPFLPQLPTPFLQHRLEAFHISSNLLRDVVPDFFPRQSDTFVTFGQDG